MDYRLPLKTVHNILKLYVKGEVSSKASKSVRDLLECILIDIAEASNTYLNETNSYREYQKLPIRKRLDIDMLESVVNQYLNHSGVLFKRISDFNLGTSARSSRDTDVSKQVK